MRKLYNPAIHGPLKNQKKSEEITLNDIEITDSKKWNYIEIMFYPFLLVMNTLYPNDKIKHKIVLYFSVLGLLKGYSFKAINFLINQSLLESNHGKSNLTQIGLNVIGMRCVTKRQTTQMGCYTTNSNGDFGTYSSVFDCVKDRFLWGEYYNEPKKYPQIKTLAEDVYNPSEGVIYTDKIDSMPNIIWCVILVLLSFPISLLIIYKLLKWVK